MAYTVLVTGKELIKRLLQGERDFGGSKIIGDPLNPDELREINGYLAGENDGRLKKAPIIMDDSDISGLKLPAIYSPENKVIGIYAPHTRARGVVAVHADLSGSYLEGADFGPFARPNRTETRSNLSYATFNEAYMKNTVLAGSNVRGTRFMFTNLWDADLRDIVNFDKARYMDTAIMSNGQRCYLKSLLKVS